MGKNILNGIVSISWGYGAASSLRLRKKTLAMSPLRPLLTTFGPRTTSDSPTFP